LVVRRLRSNGDVMRRALDRSPMVSPGICHVSAHRLRKDLVMALPDLSLLVAGLPAATPANRQLGTKIHTEGSIEVVTAGDPLVVRVHGRGRIARRTITMAQVGDVLSWRCSCKSAVSPWCKHVVALALSVDQGELDGLT
jgi:hypothetical protein